MTYQVLARKWRPKDFASLVGQEHVVRALTHALDGGRLHHAYLFTGTRGVGKTTLSRIFTKALNCETGVTSTPCGVCRACREIDEGRFVDYVEMDAASNRGVDEMAALLERAVYAPVDARFKVYMIDEVHMLTNHAFNAMLKTLEEPPSHVKFILATTDPQKIPVTVLSRCLQFNLKQMPAGHIVSHLERILGEEQVAFEPQALRLLARAADGSMRDALSLTDQAIAYSANQVTEEAVRGMLGALDQSYLVRLIDALVAADGATVLAIADEMALRSLSFPTALQDLAGLFHRVAWAQFAPASVLDEWPEAADIRRFADALSPEQVQLFYQIATLGRSELGLAPDEYAGFTMTLLRMLAFEPSTATGGAGSAPASKQAAAPAGGRAVAPALASSARAVAGAGAPTPRGGDAVPSMAPDETAKGGARATRGVAGKDAASAKDREAAGSSAAAPVSTDATAADAAALPTPPWESADDATAAPVAAGEVASSGNALSDAGAAVRSSGEVASGVSSRGDAESDASAAVSLGSDVAAAEPSDNDALIGATAAAAPRSDASSGASGTVPPDSDALSDASAAAPPGTTAAAPLRSNDEPDASAPVSASDAPSDTTAAAASRSDTRSDAIAAAPPSGDAAATRAAQPAASATRRGGASAALDVLRSAGMKLSGERSGRAAPAAPKPSPRAAVPVPQPDPGRRAAAIEARDSTSRQPARAVAPRDDADGMPPWDDIPPDDYMPADAYFAPPDDPVDHFVPAFDSEPSPARSAASVSAAQVAAIVDVSKLPPGIPLDPIGFDGDWPALAAALPLKGISYQLAFNSELTALDGSTLTLSVPVPQYADASQVAKLKAALAERLGKPLDVVVEVGPARRTAAALDAAARAERQRDAEREIGADPFVQQLIRDFGASIVPGSVKPLAPDAAGGATH